MGLGGGAAAAAPLPDCNRDCDVSGDDHATAKSTAKNAALTATWQERPAAAIASVCVRERECVCVCVCACEIIQ